MSELIESLPAYLIILVWLWVLHEIVFGGGHE